MRETIRNKALNSPINIIEEYQRIDFLFSQNSPIGGFNQWGSRVYEVGTIEQYIDNLLFIRWEYRDRFINITDYRRALHIDRDMLSKKIDNETFLTYIEYVLNMIYLFEKGLDSDRFYLSDVNYIQTLIHNIVLVVDRLNYSITNENGLYIIQEKDASMSALADKHEDIAYRLIEYRRHNMKGDIESKTEILMSLWKKYEPIRDKLKQNNQSKLDDYIGFLLNEVNMRHNNVEGKKAHKLVQKMQNSEFEPWCDQAYDFILLALMLNDYYQVKDDVDKFMKEVIAGDSK